MDLWRPKNTTELRAFIRMVQYCRDMSPMLSHTLLPLKELSRDPKGREIVELYNIRVLLETKVYCVYLDFVELSRLEHLFHIAQKCL